MCNDSIEEDKCLLWCNMILEELKLGQIVKSDKYSCYFLVIGMMENDFSDFIDEESYVACYKLCEYPSANTIDLKGIVKENLLRVVDENNIFVLSLKGLTKVLVRPYTEKVNQWLIKSSMVNDSFSKKFIHLISVEEFKQQETDMQKKLDRYLSYVKENLKHRQAGYSIKDMKSGDVLLRGLNLVIYVHGNLFMEFDTNKYDEKIFVLKEHYNYYFSRRTKIVSFSDLINLNINICELAYNRVRLNQIFRYYA